MGKNNVLCCIGDENGFSAHIALVESIAAARGLATHPRMEVLRTFQTKDGKGEELCEWILQFLNPHHMGGSTYAGEPALALLDAVIDRDGKMSEGNLFDHPLWAISAAVEKDGGLYEKAAASIIRYAGYARMFYIDCPMPLKAWLWRYIEEGKFRRLARRAWLHGSNDYEVFPLLGTLRDYLEFADRNGDAMVGMGEIFAAWADMDRAVYQMSEKASA